MDLSESVEAAGAVAHSVPTAWREAAPGRQLRALRLSLGVSQRHLSEDSGVAQSVISRVESGREVRWELLRRLYQSLGHEPLIVPLATSEDAGSLISDEIQKREDRAEAGRFARWG